MLLRRHRENKQVKEQAVEKQPDIKPVVEEVKVEETPKKSRSKK